MMIFFFIVVVVRLFSNGSIDRRPIGGNIGTSTILVRVRAG